MFNIIYFFVFIHFFWACAMAPAFANGNSEEPLTKEKIESLPIEGCDFGFECSYTPLTNPEGLITTVRNAVTSEPTLGPIFNEDHHVVGKTKLEIRNGIIYFSSLSNECELPVRQNGKRTKITGINCESLINYLLIKKDVRQKPKTKDTYRVNLVVYQYDTSGEEGYNLGFQGQSGSAVTEKSRASLSYDSAEPLSSLLNFNLGDLTSNLLSLNLNLGSLGGYIKTFQSYKSHEIEADSTFNFAIDARTVYARSGVASGTDVISDDVGLFIKGTIVPEFGNDNFVNLRSSSFKHVRATGDAYSNDESFSLTKKIDLSRHGSEFNQRVELNKPIFLFDLKAIDLIKEKGWGFFFSKDKTVSQTVNLIVTLNINKVNATEPTPVAFQVSSAAHLDFRSIFKSENVVITNEPVIAQVGANPNDLRNSDILDDIINYKVKPYYLKLNLTDEQKNNKAIMSQKVSISITGDSAVRLLGREPNYVASIHELANKGFYFGVEPKNQPLFVEQLRPLKFGLKLTLDKPSITNPEHWTEDHLSNSVIYDIQHNVFSLDIYSMSKQIRVFNYLRW